MKTKHFSKAACLLIAAMLAGCSGDNMTNEATDPQQQPETQGMTEFAVAEKPAETAGAPQTRTSGEYTGSAIKFYWTSGDRLWINDGSSLKASSRSNIPATGGKETTAKFWFDGTYTATTYPVRYTGNGNTAGDKVTIKAAQAQQSANDGAHIGTDGDCGTATATKGADGRYNFTLAHKASYLTFMPYYSKGFDPSVKVTQIKVTADQPLAGTFDFNDAGIQTYTVTEASNSITLTLNGGGTNGFEIPTAIDYSKNAAIMVVNPNSFTNFTVEYTLHDQVTNVTGTVTKNYGSVACYAGKNKKIAADLAVTNYSDMKFYMWDAQQDYWNGVANSPTLNGQLNNNYPQTSADPRWYNTESFPVAANHSCQSCPNVNELYWYVKHGNPHYELETLWSTMGHLYHGGAWLKKQTVIANENGKSVTELKGTSPDGIDYRNYLLIPQAYYRNESLIKTRPTNVEDYFFLPALGFSDNYNVFGLGQLSLEGMSTYGFYWSSSSCPDNDKAYYLYFGNNYMDFSTLPRLMGFHLMDIQ